MTSRQTIKGILAIVFILGFFGIIALLVFVKPPEGVDDILKMMLGAVVTYLGVILNQYFENK